MTDLMGRIEQRVVATSNGPAVQTTVRTDNELTTDARIHADPADLDFQLDPIRNEYVIGEAMQSIAPDFHSLAHNLEVAITPALQAQGVSLTPDLTRQLANDVAENILALGMTTRPGPRMNSGQIIAVPQNSIQFGLTSNMEPSVEHGLLAYETLGNPTRK